MFRRLTHIHIMFVYIFYILDSRWTFRTVSIRWFSISIRTQCTLSCICGWLCVQSIHCAIVSCGVLSVTYTTCTVCIYLTCITCSYQRSKVNKYRYYNVVSARRDKSGEHVWCQYCARWRLYFTELLLLLYYITPYVLRLFCNKSNLCNKMLKYFRII
jgi:hypothetical protein